MGQEETADSYEEDPEKHAEEFAAQACNFLYDHKGRLPKSKRPLRFVKSIEPCAVCEQIVHNFRDILRKYRPRRQNFKQGFCVPAVACDIGDADPTAVGRLHVQIIAPPRFLHTVVDAKALEPGGRAQRILPRSRVVQRNPSIAFFDVRPV